MKKAYLVTRLVEETCEVEAGSKAEAIRIAGEEGRNWDSIIKKETAKERTAL
jgi:hypothetical protein